MKNEGKTATVIGHVTEELAQTARAAALAAGITVSRIVGDALHAYVPTLRAPVFPPGDGDVERLP